MVRVYDSANSIIKSLDLVNLNNTKELGSYGNKITRISMFYVSVLDEKVTVNCYSDNLLNMIGSKQQVPNFSINNSNLQKE